MHRRQVLASAFAGLSTVAGCLRLQEAEGTAEFPPDGVDLLIQITAEQFRWVFEPDTDIGTQEGQLVIPANTTIGFAVSSVDVWHTFGIPDLGLKVDAVPGEMATTWIATDEVSQVDTFHTETTAYDAEHHQAECFELCGDGHNEMTADIYVVSRADYREYISDSDGTIPEELAHD